MLTDDVNESLLPEELVTNFGQVANKKLLALTSFAETESVEAAALASGQSPVVVRKWVRDPKNQSVIKDLRDAVRVGMANRYLQIVHVSTNKILERLEHGDPHVLRDGTIIYKPVSARELAAIADIASSKHAVLTGNIAPEAMNNDRLRALADLISQEIPRRVAAEVGKRKPKSLPQPDGEDVVE